MEMVPGPSNQLLCLLLRACFEGGALGALGALAARLMRAQRNDSFRASMCKIMGKRIPLVFLRQLESSTRPCCESQQQKSRVRGLMGMGGVVKCECTFCPLKSLVLQSYR